MKKKKKKKKKKKYVLSKIMYKINKKTIKKCKRIVPQVQKVSVLRPLFMSQPSSVMCQ